MKRTFLLPALLLTGLVAMAQNYDEAKNLVLLMQLPKAKEAVDKGMTNAKYASKPEAYILKATVYSSLAIDPKIKDTPEGDKYLADAEAAWNKYKEMDPSLAYLKDLAYQNAPINIYSGYFNSGYKDYQEKKWQSGYEKFIKVVDLSDMLIAQKIINITGVDTNSVLLAGILAENSKHEAEAAKYYARIAELKLDSPDYEGIYRYLVKYSFTVKDMAGFDKYRAMGKQLFPKSEYFNFDKVDFAIGLEDDFNKKIQALDEAIASNPNNTKALELLGEIIYDTIYSNKEGAVQPANAAELTKKMEGAFKKLGEIEPNSEIAFLFLGNHHITRSIDADSIRSAFADEVKKKTKPGTKVSAADQAKIDALEASYANELEGAREPFEKAAAIYPKKEKMTNSDKLQYKKLVGYLADIYSYKKAHVKNNPADLAKFTAEEKKWNDLYDTIK
ncbi:MAG TPA: hypothetical protein VLJ68_01480 [Chitinophagaceae bacterium]|nr:hypothetical protein [Chitinophagaceae bacterium]